MKTLIVIHDLTQLPALVHHLGSLSNEERSETRVLALGLDIEYALEKGSISFLSAREFRTVSSFDRMVYAIDLADRISADENFSFFAHRGISLFSLYHIRIQWYIVLLTYYVDIFTAVLDAHQDIRTICAFHPTIVVSPFSDVAASFETRLVPDTLRLVCEQRHVNCSLIGKSPTRARSPNHVWFLLQRKIFGALLFLANTLQLLRPRRKIKILASEYWRNIAPLLHELPESEMVLLDRMESLNAGMRAWWKHQIRFIQLRSFSSRTMRIAAKEQGDSFARAFNTAKEQASSLRNARFRGCTITPLIEAVMERIVSVGGTEGVLSIDCAFRMLSHLQPDIVIVRASASGQIHFPVLCLVAKSMGIPSLEVQHGHLYMGEGSLTRRRTAEYIAVYGPAVRSEMKKAGYSDDKIIDAGSPRFDSYRPTPLVQNAEVQITCIAPSFVPGFFDDSYEVAEYFEAVSMALKNSSAKLAIKLRLGLRIRFFEEVLQRAFKEREYEVHEYTPLQTLFSRSDIVISPVSTVLFESLIMERPTIFFAFSKVHYTLGAEFISYADKGLLVARTAQDLKEKIDLLVGNYDERVRLWKGAEECIATHYSFDGHSAERIANAIRRLVKK